MLYSLMLTLHLSGAVITGLAAALSMFALIRKWDHVYSLCASYIAYLAAFQIISGIGLSILSLEVTTISLCKNLAFYLAACAIVELALFMRMKKVQLHFPLQITISPVLASLVLFVAAISFGF